MQKLDVQGLNEEQFLKQYDPDKYPRPSVTADIVIFTIADKQEANYRKLPEKDFRILLIKRGGHPFLGKWALPGGFVRPDETVGKAANRELIEETGISGGHLEQLYTFSKPGRDPRTWVISCAHMALIKSEDLLLNAGSDADDAQWFSLNIKEEHGLINMSLSNNDIHLSVKINTEPNDMENSIIENDGLAFDHAAIICCALNRLRGKLEYTDLVFKLMPTLFTLSELQQVYETILGKKLYKAAFRRKMKDFVVETGHFTENAGHRPSQLYIYNKDNNKHW